MNIFLENLETKLAKKKRDLSNLSADEQLYLLKSRAVHVVKEDLLYKRLKDAKNSGQPLRVKYGIDPTSPDAHLGHVAPIMLARLLQQMGHHVIILFGNFTALVGDPSGRVKTRPVLTPEDIERNVSSYSEQIGKFIDMTQVEIAYNAPFFENLSILELLNFYRSNKIAPILQRDDFRQRAEGLTIAEALYPTLMAIDSISLKADIELGGNDQLLNFHTAVAFMESVGMVPQSSLTTELLQGTSGDGKKMSKSEGNYIALTESADQAFGKIMSIPDKLLEQFYKLLTDITDDEWRHLDKDMCSGELNPIEVKKMLARLIVERLHSREAAIREQQAFEKVFSRHALPDDMPEFAIKPGGDVKNISDLVLHCGFSSTRSEVRRLIQGGAVRSIINGEVTNLDDPFRNLPNIDSWVLNVGKRRYAKIIFKDIAAPSPQKSDPDATADNSNVVASPMSKFNHLLSHISLVDHTSSFAGLHPSLFDNQLNGGALYFGTGLCTSKAMSVGLPFDVIGMVCVAEKIRRFLGLDKIIQLIADTHAKSNSFTVDSEVDEAAQSVKATMLRVASSLGLEDVYSPILSSDFDSSDEYLSIFKKIDTNDHEYVRREWSDIEYLRQHHALRIKLSWTIGHKVKKVGFDERLYDRRFADVTGNPMSFVYLNAGRTLDKSRPKASPYICIPGERRILLRRGEDVAGKLRDAEKDFGSPSLKGAQKHLNDIVLMHEEMFGSLGDNLTLDENINRIIDKCC